LKPLEEVDNFIKPSKHLPVVPSASEVKAGLPAKIEELTFYLLLQQLQIDELNRRVKKVE